LPPSFRGSRRRSGTIGKPCEIVHAQASRHRDCRHLHDVDGSLADDVATQHLPGLAIGHQLAESFASPVDDRARCGVEADDRREYVVRSAGRRFG
jgi:hypothetical protein